MCGVAGIVRNGSAPASEEALRRMARALHHRGPDGYGLALEPGAGFVATRLAIFDPDRGWQPLVDPGSGGGLLAYNGEVFNHPELRAGLEARGERLATTCDTEVVLRLLELDGIACLPRLNGQFAFAWWQPDRRRLTLVRDRFGIRPLHYAICADGAIAFGSEAKALFASGEVVAEPDLEGIDEVFTLWGAQPPRTAFAGVCQLRPGEVVVWERGHIVDRHQWWDGVDGGGGSGPGELSGLLDDSVSLRLRADVPVGAYLSGGIDSSLTSAIARRIVGERLETFSVAFADAAYDERSHQRLVADALGTRHHTLEVSNSDIAAAFPTVVAHAETPMVRTAPAPLLLLAGEVRAAGITAVITGEGADEVFWGYDLLKEVALQQLHRSDPAAALELVADLYPELGGARASWRGDAWKHAILSGGSSDDPIASHATRIAATGAVRALYRPEVAAELSSRRGLEALRDSLPEGFAARDPLERAAWLEVRTLLGPYLLATQGDRMAMAHGVEGRFPFLDHRVVACAGELPPARKLDGLRDKVALRELAAGLLPAEIAERPKQPYKAPEVEPFFAAGSPEWVERALDPEAIAATGIWDERKTAGLLRRCRAGKVRTPREAMAVVGMLSTQLWHSTFIGRDQASYPEQTADPRVRVERGPSGAAAIEE